MSHVIAWELAMEFPSCGDSAELADGRESFPTPEAGLSRRSGRAPDWDSSLPRRFTKTISAVDSSTIALVANAMNWAKHRRRKAAAKMHLRLNLQTFLPACAVIEEASQHDDGHTASRGSSRCFAE